MLRAWLQVQQEMLTGIMGKLERDLASAQRNCEAATAKGENAAEEFAKLERAQAAMDERLARCAAERRALEAEAAAVDKAFMRAAAQNVEVEERMVAVLGEQTTVEKGAGGTAKAIQRLRKDVRAPCQRERLHACWRVAGCGAMGIRIATHGPATGSFPRV